MKYQSKTLRKLPPTARALARLINELDSVVTRASNQLDKMVSLEHEAIAMRRHVCSPRCQYQDVTCPHFLQPPDPIIFAEERDHHEG